MLFHEIFIVKLFLKKKKVFLGSYEAVNLFWKLLQFSEEHKELNKEIEKVICAIYGYSRLLSKEIYVHSLNWEEKLLTFPNLNLGGLIVIMMALIATKKAFAK